jgi:hypothetical protein
MMNTTGLLKFAVGTVGLLFMAGLARPCVAQSLLGIRVGESATVLSRLGPAAETDNYKGMTVRRWNLQNGNELSATVGTNGKIAYVESDWNGKSDDSGCDLRGLRFGITTLNELRKRFGSNGFEYTGRGSVANTQEGVVMMNSYDAGGVVITFYTKINRDEFSRANASRTDPSLADYAKLDAISLTDDGYAKNEWGDRVYDPAYKKIDWK